MEVLVLTIKMSSNANYVLHQKTITVSKSCDRFEKM